MTWTRTPPARPGWYWYRRLAWKPVVAEVVLVTYAEAGHGADIYECGACGHVAVDVDAEDS